MKACCLILDQDAEHAARLSKLCADIGFEIKQCSSTAQARDAINDCNIVVAFVDFDFGDGSGGMSLLEDGSLDAVEAMFMSDDDNPQQADQAARLGASYFFCKPFDAELIGPLLQDIASESSPSETQHENDGVPCAVDQFGFLRGSSKSMRKLYRLLRKVAQSDASLMIVGESGTGKELVAQTAHTLSPRSEGPFVAFNCAAVAENLAESELFGHEKGSFSGAHSRHHGYFERAHGGTLFLDEITEMDIDLQAKLLRVLETQTLSRLGSESTLDIDVRFISATNCSPEQAIADGKLREDLYYRLAQFPIRMPPLRQRDGDITGLAQYFLNTLNEKHDTEIAFTEGALQALQVKAWPGNVRELKNYVERAYIMSESVIDVAALPDSDLAPVAARRTPEEADEKQIGVPAGATLADAERILILASLERHDGDKKSAAAELGISLKTLYNRLRDYSDPESHSEHSEEGANDAASSP